MKRFRFKLQRLIELRAYREHEWEIKLGEITGKCVSLKNGIRDRKKRKREVFKTRTSGDQAYESSIEFYIKRLDIEVIRLKDQLADAEKLRKEVRTEYLEASKKRKVLDKLREKRGLEFRKEQLSADVKAVDDINTGAAARRRMN